MKELVLQQSKLKTMDKEKLPDWQAELKALALDKLDNLRDVTTLRNQLLNEVVKKSVEYDEKTDMIRMKKKDYDTLIRDWEKTTDKIKKQIEKHHG